MLATLWAAVRKVRGCRKAEERTSGCWRRWHEYMIQGSEPALCVRNEQQGFGTTKKPGKSETKMLPVQETGFAWALWQREIAFVLENCLEDMSRSGTGW